MKTGDGSDCSDWPTEPRSDAGRDADDIRSRHDLAQGQDFGELPVVHPSLSFDNDAPCPDQPATKTEKGNLEEAEKECSQRSVLRETSRAHPLGHGSQP
jgi:hypothetical protein